jgi:hypothetical protein
MYQRGRFALLQRKSLEYTPDKLMSKEMGYDEDNAGIIAKLQQLFFNGKLCCDLIGINF